jgi:pectinesterase
MNCELGAHIRPEGWHNWEKHREQTARYLEYNNRGAGYQPKQRVSWSRQLTKTEASKITPKTVFNRNDGWEPTI